MVALLQEVIKVPVSCLAAFLSLGCCLHLYDPGWLSSTFQPMGRGRGKERLCLFHLGARFRSHMRCFFFYLNAQNLDTSSLSCKGGLEL